MIPETVFTDEKEGDDEDNEQKEADHIKEEQQPLSVIEILAAHREQVIQKKLKIAQLSMDIVENPYEKVCFYVVYTFILY